MKRNWDTIRELLTKVEECCTRPVDSVRLSTFPIGREAEISYHMALLIEAGLVNGQMSKSLNQEVNDFFVQRLTWEGHEFLDSIRNDTVWAKTKTVFREKGIDMSLDLVKAITKDIATSFLKAALGS